MESEQTDEGGEIIEPVTDHDRKEMAELIASQTKTLDDFPALKEILGGLLNSGYTNAGICGEFLLLDVELLSLRERCPPGWWERNQVGSERWLSRKIARKLTRFGPDDMAIIQAKAPEYNPKQRIDIGIQEVEGIKILLPERKRPIDMVEGPKDTFNAEKA